MDYKEIKIDEFENVTGGSGDKFSDYFSGYISWNNVKGFKNSELYFVKKESNTSDEILWFKAKVYDSPNFNELTVYITESGDMAVKMGFRVNTDTVINSLFSTYTTKL